ncbi:ATP synthase F1 subunit gamma [Candidatus Karelsulcia muelleri]|uniref:ATP synthase F1 subunit gamma n=1 Tax=Candidatus Karelsulcia muelleri TaxID=336810 RepID=UPI0007F985E5|nr:ATP synthase F1 subunit gamma [Candidatus Karelsulcia muelleri]ANO35689.1 ATP synthase F1 subunit gamma [Candidatus Karelsulcia muelleri]QSF25078.1 ATP synthase F1 subunit gamma [Candidatus Karelsulcia muelleri]BEH03804.1 ATP synthase gamma chain [Candidatus Karelsulcia muelleri]
MSNLKEIIGRVKTVSSIVKITNAMKMVSSVKLKKYQEKIYKCKIYKKKIEEIFRLLYPDPYTYNTKKPILLIVITSNRGLCGNFNNLLLKKTEKLIESCKKKTYILSIGKIGKDFLDKKYPIYLYNRDLIENINEINLSNIVDDIYKKFLNGYFSNIKIIYNSCKKLISIKQILPLKIKNIKKKNYLFEPSEEEILKYLFPEIIKIKIYKYILESITSEHLSRMIAMHKAKDNGIKINNELLFIYNKLRKENITKEILEIVGGI